MLKIRQATGIVTVGGDLVVSGTGPHAFGGDILDYVQFHFTGAFTSGGASTTTTGILANLALTGASGDTGSLVGTRLAGSHATQTATEDIAYIAQLAVEEPAITDNLTGDIAVATTVYIKSAPTEGNSNYALWIVDGRSRCGGVTDYFGIGADPSYMLHVQYTNNGLGQRRAMHLGNGDADTPEGMRIDYANANPNNQAYPFIQCSDSAVATRMVVYSNGDIVNTNNSYGATSDRILKQDIVDANSQWDDVKALSAMGKNYRFIADVEHEGDDAMTHLGLVAQDVETVSPGLVGQEETERDGLMPKSLKYSVMYMKAFLALGEAMNRIEDLESRIEALEA